MARNSLGLRGLSVLLCVLLLLICGCRLSAQNAASCNLTVRVTGLRNAKGVVRLTLFRDTKAIETRELQIDPATLTAKVGFEKLPQGTYAVNLFHDENKNGKMDQNFVGMPTEGYGMSNNPKKRMGKPGFDETNFQINQPEMAIEIKTIYW